MKNTQKKKITGSLPSANEKLSTRDSADRPKDIGDSLSHALAT